MRLSELKPCAVCKGKITPIWYVIRISQAMLKPQAANEVLSLTQMFGGNLTLAEVMAPEADCVLVMGDAEPLLMTEINVCQQCFLSRPIEMALLMEAAHEESSDTTQERG